MKHVQPGRQAVGVQGVWIPERERMDQKDPYMEFGVPRGKLESPEGRWSFESRQGIWNPRGEKGNPSRGRLWSP